MVQFVRIIPDAVLPTRGSRHAAGLDLSAAWAGDFPGFRIWPNQRALIPTGLRVAIPFGCYGQIHPRSGIALNNGIDVFAGVIDADYRGEIKIILYNSGEESFLVEKGMRVAQFIIKPCNMQDAEEVPSLPEPTTDGFRGSAGFGSTGV
jgi:deoxyuridine 5'-triphosphate nucleotidohydrolase